MTTSLIVLNGGTITKLKTKAEDVHIGAYRQSKAPQTALLAQYERAIIANLSFPSAYLLNR